MRTFKIIFTNDNLKATHITKKKFYELCEAVDYAENYLINTNDSDIVKYEIREITNELTM